MASPQTPSKESEQATSTRRKAEPPSLRTPQKIVYIKVGNTKETFGVHKDLACFHSPYFRAAFEGNFEEAKFGEIVLESAEPKVFGPVVEWLYSQDLQETICTDEAIPGYQKFGLDLPLFGHLVMLWLLAEYLQMPKLQNKSLDVIGKRFLRNRTYSCEFCHYVYENTTDGSLLRKYFVDRLCWSRISAKTIINFKDKIPLEMYVDLFVAERERRQNPAQNPLQDMSSYMVDDGRKQ